MKTKREIEARIARLKAQHDNLKPEKEVLRQLINGKLDALLWAIGQ